MKEIILFCYGDSADASTWSNVPYLMSQSLIDKGILLHRVDLSPNGLFERIANRLLRPFRLGKLYSYIRTPLFRLLTELKIRHAVNSHPSADFCIFLNFDFYNRFSSIPSLVFSDWTFKILSEREGFLPSRAEQGFIDWQAHIINNATIVLPLFSESAVIMKASYPQANIHVLPGNVINRIDPIPLGSPDEIIARKLRHDTILFIGRDAYIEGLKTLIDAASLLARRPHIHVIGMSADQMSDAPDFVTFHGFLRKNDTDENRLYYSLLRDARLIVNPTPRWAGYSSIIEAMYYYTPVVVTPFTQFVKEFAPDIDFGCYVSPEESAAELADTIHKILSLPPTDYRTMALNAHARVHTYTWDTYTDSMLSLMSGYLSSGHGS